MALTQTNTGVTVVGDRKHLWGTFTTADKDTGGDIATGFGVISGYEVSLDTGGLETPRPKTSVSGGTITITVSDTEGYSGRFWAQGK